MARGPGPPIGLGDGPLCPDTTLLPSPPFDVQISATSSGPGGLPVAAGNGSSRFPWPFRCSPLHRRVLLDMGYEYRRPSPILGDKEVLVRPRIGVKEQRRSHYAASSGVV